MFSKLGQISCVHIDQLLDSNGMLDDLFADSIAETQKELDSINRPETLPLPSLALPSDIFVTTRLKQHHKKASPTSRQTSKDQNIQERTLLSRIVTSAVLIALLWGGMWAWQHRSNANHSLSSQLTSLSFEQSKLPQYVTKSIEDIEIGGRVLGKNPEVSDADRALFGREPTPETYSCYQLVLPKENGTITFVELLRPHDWLNDEIAEIVELENEDDEQEEAVLVWLELPEMGTVGWAELLDIFQFDKFESGTGNLVTGTFCHLAPDTIDLVIEDIAPIGCTPNHPFWSVDRQAYIDAGELFAGESVLLYSGETKRVIQKLARPGPETVYNIEVFGEHVYHVTQGGVLVHNEYANPKDIRYTQDSIQGQFSDKKSIKAS